MKKLVEITSEQFWELYRAALKAGATHIIAGRGLSFRQIDADRGSPINFFVMGDVEGHCRQVRDIEIPVGKKLEKVFLDPGTGEVVVSLDKETEMYTLRIVNSFDLNRMLGEIPSVDESTPPSKNPLAGVDFSKAVNLQWKDTEVSQGVFFTTYVVDMPDGEKFTIEVRWNTVSSGFFVQRVHRGTSILSHNGKPCLVSVEGVEVSQALENARDAWCRRG